MRPVAGIIAEYNPFHNGHLYQLRQTAERLGEAGEAPVLIVAMSGQFTQRGEPAVADKWCRAEAAIRGGADLVVELPTACCVREARTFARTGVALLEGLGATWISFGCEAVDEAILTATAEKLDRHEAALEGAIRDGMRAGLSWPRARERAAAEFLTAQELPCLRGPNNILALEYIRAMRTARPLAIPRLGGGHLDDGPAAGIAPARWIRERCRAGLDVSPWMPDFSLALLLHGGKGADGCEDPAARAAVPAATVGVPTGVSRKGAASAVGTAAAGGADAEARRELAGRLAHAEDRMFLLLCEKALSLPPERLEDAPAGGEGLGYRLQEAARCAGSMEELLCRMKSKRYTRARLSRYLAQLLLGIRRQAPLPATAFSDGADAAPPLYARVLAMSARGRAYLHELKARGTCPFPILSNVNKEAGRLSPAAGALLRLDMHATDMFHLLRGEPLSVSADVQRPAMHIPPPGPA